MPREKKETRPFSIRMESDVYERLADFCEKSGQAKTTAIERAVCMYIDDYEEKCRKLEESYRKSAGKDRTYAKM